MKTKNLLLRIIVCPFVLGIMLVKFNYVCLERLIYFLKYGGEWINYTKEDSVTIQKVYELLKEINESAK